MSDPELYHAEVSFYSQLSRLALTERGIVYKSRLVDYGGGENRTEKYFREVNRKGTLPTLIHKGVRFMESRDIIDYADTLPSERPKLCPHGNSEEEDLIRHFWSKMASLNMMIISYGAMYHRHLTVNCIPSVLLMNPRKITERLTRYVDETNQIKQDFPELATGMKGRRDFSAVRDAVADEGTVLEEFKKCDDLLGEVEDQLQKMKSKYDGAPEIEYWLCGENFSVVDVFLSCFLHRLTFVGMAERLFLAKRPLTSDYYQCVLRRKSFVQEVAWANNVWRSYVGPMVRVQARRACPYFLSGVLVGGAGYFAYRRSLDLKQVVSQVWEYYLDNKK